MKKLLILIMLAIMVTLVALPAMASACGGCLLSSASVIAADTMPVTSIVEPYVETDIDYAGAPGGAIVSKRGIFYIDSNFAEVPLIDSGGGGCHAIASNRKSYMTIRTSGEHMIPFARDMTGLV